MRTLTVLLMLVITSPVYANPLLMLSGGAITGCTSPASGTVIIGTDTTSSAAYVDYQTARQHFWNVDSAATWTETCTTTTVGTCEFYVRGWDGGNCKGVLLNSDGSIVTNGTSNATAIAYEGSGSWHSFTMGTPPTVTKSSNYKGAIVCDTNYAARLLYNDSGTQSFGYEASGNYTTPVAVTIPPDVAVDATATFTNFRCKK